MPHALENETILLRQVAKGDHQAYRILFDHYFRHVYGLALRFTKSPELAEDLAQDIFTRLWTHRSALISVREFRPYLNTVAINLVRDYLKKRVVITENEPYLLAYFGDPSPSTEEKIALKDLEKIIREAIDQLSPQLKTAFILSRYQELTHAEIAEKMHISVITSKSHIVRALASIRKYLQQHYPQLAGFILLFCYCR
jgi:RNA polymerase sigma-70 factor (ECF subfamily)